MNKYKVGDLVEYIKDPEGLYIVEEVEDFSNKEGRVRIKEVYKHKDYGALIDSSDIKEASFKKLVEVVASYEEPKPKPEYQQGMQDEYEDIARDIEKIGKRLEKITKFINNQKKERTISNLEFELLEYQQTEMENVVNYFEEYRRALGLRLDNYKLEH